MQEKTSYHSLSGQVWFYAEPASQECRDKAKQISEENIEAVFDWYDEFFSITPGYPIDREVAENKKHVLQELKLCKAY